MTTKPFSTNNSSPNNSKCLWKEFREQTTDELFDRMMELQSTERDEIIDEEIWDKEFEALKKRFIENEELRRFVIDLRDNPHPITSDQVIERLTNNTEDLKV